MGGETEGGDVQLALRGALTHTILSTATAMLAASLAYGSLIVTDFRGFSQFGLIGGAGMIFVWICSMIVVPPVVLLGERLRPGVFTPKTNLWRIPFLWLGKGGGSLPGLTVLGLVALTTLSVFRCASMFKIRSSGTSTTCAAIPPKRRVCGIGCMRWEWATSGPVISATTVCCL